MAIELVTGYQGRDHVTADQWADFNRGIFGDAAILPVGNKMEVAIQTANKITVKDGIAVIDGRQVSIGYGESENITIKSGTQGKLRRDIVVLEYKRVEDTGVESVQFKVIDGTPATSNAQDPAVRNTDIRTGAIVSQKPFCRVRLNGTAIEGVDSLIRVKELKDMAFYEPVNNLVGTDPKMALAAPMGKELKKSIDQINTNLIQKINYGEITETSHLLGETEKIKRFTILVELQAKKITVNLSEISNAKYIWVDESNSFLYNPYNKTVYPISYYGGADNSCFYKVVYSDNPYIEINTRGDWSYHNAMITLFFY